MTPWQIISAIVWAVGVPIIIYLLWRIVQRKRQIDQRIAELREEEAQNAANPYAAMAQLYEAQQLLEQARAEGRGPRGARERLHNARKRLEQTPPQPAPTKNGDGSSSDGVPRIKNGR